MKRFIQKIPISIFIFLPTISFAASFDCKKAKSAVEQAICADAELGKLDVELSQSVNLKDILLPLKVVKRLIKMESLSFLL